MTLAEIVRREVDWYAGDTHDAKLYAVLDDKSQTYAVVCVPEKQDERPLWVIVMAQVVGGKVVILEDRFLDPNQALVEALMAKGNIPREKIVLAYAGEKLSEAQTADGQS